MTARTFSAIGELVRRELVKADEPLSRRELERRTNQDKYKVLRGVRELEEADLVDRHRDAGDMRVALYYLSE